MDKTYMADITSRKPNNSKNPPSKQTDLTDSGGSELLFAKDNQIKCNLLRKTQQHQSCYSVSN